MIFKERLYEECTTRHGSLVCEYISGLRQAIPCFAIALFFISPAHAQTYSSKSLGIEKKKPTHSSRSLGTKKNEPTYRITSPCDNVSNFKTTSDLVYEDGRNAAGEAIAGANVPGSYDVSLLTEQQRIFLDIPIDGYIEPDRGNIDLREALIGVGDIMVNGEDATLNGQPIIPSQPLIECD